VSACAYVAQIGDPGSATGTAGLVRTRQSSSNVNAVVVETYRVSSNGSTLLDDNSFHLAVFCTP
jgi:hypothetical protein